MRRFKRNRRIHVGKIFSLVGAAFLVAIAGSIYLYGSYWENGLDDDAHQMLIEGRYDVIDDGKIYGLLDAIKSEIVKYDQYPNLQINTRKFDRGISSFLESIDEQLLPSFQRNELMRGILTKTWIWDAKRLPGYHCLSPREIAKIREKWDEVLSRDDHDFPSEASLSFHQFSRPVFTKDGRYALIQHYYYCAPLCASEKILLFTKDEGRWELVKVEELWAS
jgi:hypothetical protein